MDPGQAAPAGVSSAKRDERPGGRRSRLEEAGKQLAIVLEAVDLEAEPELGEALTSAVSSVERARRRVGSAVGDDPSRDTPERLPVP